MSPGHGIGVAFPRVSLFMAHHQLKTDNILCEWRENNRLRRVSFLFLLRDPVILNSRYSSIYLQHTKIQLMRAEWSARRCPKKKSLHWESLTEPICVWMTGCIESIQNLSKQSCRLHWKRTVMCCKAHLQSLHGTFCLHGVKVFVFPSRKAVFWYLPC